MTKSVTIWEYGKFEKKKFSTYYFNKDILFHISTCLNFQHTYEGLIEGSVSQNFYLGPSYHFIKSRKLS